ncbi:MAG: hypothetical protein AB1665_04175 [Candidatus Thermoplasmatota archaeon]
MAHEIRQKRLSGVDAQTEQWLKEHTIQDLRDLVFELYNRGEDVSDMVRLVNDLEAMAQGLMIESRIEAAHEETEFDYIADTEMAVA